MSKLTDKQERFVKEYLIDLNATQAAIRAGYSEISARQIAEKNMSKHDIQEAIKNAQQEISKRNDITIDRVLNEYAKIAFSDVRNILTPDGGLKDAFEWDNETAGAVASIKSFEVTTPEGEKLGTNREIKMYDKLRALDSIGKHLGFFETDNKQKQAQIDLNSLSDDTINALLKAKK
ncbi:terminase small subunit [Sphingobacterium spiritivorum]|uniref:terminase small subunit n=1 Tax=Sphingobacterium spiritivorum TaxID=258 RepID=UPI003DA39849